MSIPAIDRQHSGNRFSNRQFGTPYGVDPLPPVIPAEPGCIPAISTRAARTPPRRDLGAVGGGYLARPYGRVADLVETAP